MGLMRVLKDGIANEVTEAQKVLKSLSILIHSLGVSKEAMEYITKHREIINGNSGPDWIYTWADEHSAEPYVFVECVPLALKELDALDTLIGKSFKLGQVIEQFKELLKTLGVSALPSEEEDALKTVVGLQNLLAKVRTKLKPTAKQVNYLRGDAKHGFIGILRDDKALAERTEKIATSFTAAAETTQEIVEMLENIKSSLEQVIQELSKLYAHEKEIQKLADAAAALHRQVAA